MERLYEMGSVSDSLKADVPESIRQSLCDYVHYGVPTGDFLRAVLRDNLFDSVMQADRNSLASLAAICRYISNAVPLCCYGDARIVDCHIAKGRELQKRSRQ